MPRRKAPTTTTNNNNVGEDKNRSSDAKRARIAFHLDLPERRQTIGQVLVCGTGDTGQLGLGEDIMERQRLALVQNIPDPVDICAGGMHNLVLTNTGDVYSFGCNDEGALGRDTSGDGSEMSPARIDLPAKAVRISAGDSHSACLMEDGRVYAWGSFRDSHGNMGLTIDGNKRTPINLLDDTVCCSIASGSDHLVILTRTGKVFTVGCAEQGQLGRISERSVGGEGRRGKRDLLRPDQLILKRSKPIEAIWATNYCTFMRESQTGTIWGVGLNNYRQLVVDKEGERILLPSKTDLKEIKQIAGGQHHTLALSQDSRCLVVGRPEYGRLGLGDIKTVVAELTPIKKLTDKITYVGCGEVCSYAITEEGKLYAWGMGSSAQLGVGDGDDELEPTLVNSKQTQNKRMLMADGGGQHGLFLVESDVQAQQPSKSKVPTEVDDSAKKPAAAKKRAAAEVKPQQNEETAATTAEGGEASSKKPAVPKKRAAAEVAPKQKEETAAAAAEGEESSSKKPAAKRARKKTKD